MVQRHQFTVEEYYRMGEAGALGPTPRVELIEGEIIDMSPIGSKHAAIVSQLYELLSELKPLRTSLRCQNPIRLSNTNEPEPDLALVTSHQHQYRDAHPGPSDILLLIEVADSTLEYDLKTKAPLYAKHGIPVYWVLDLEGQKLEVFFQPEGDAYQSHQTLGPSDLVVLPGAGDIALKLASLVW